MYVFDIGRFGGNGGGAWDDRERLGQQGRSLGFGPKGALASQIDVAAWGGYVPHLSTTEATYQSVSDSNSTFKGCKRGNIPGRQHTFEWDPLQEQVTKVVIWHGLHHWQSGAPCLNAIQFETWDPEARQQRRTVVGRRFTNEDCRQQDTARIYKVVLPQSFTLAGFSGRSGDSWDAIGLYICPYVPRCPQDLAAVAQSQFLARCPPPFRRQAAAVVEALEGRGLRGSVVALVIGCLFQATFFPDAAVYQPGGAAGGAQLGASAAGDALERGEGDYIGCWCAQHLQAAGAIVSVSNSGLEDWCLRL